MKQRLFLMILAVFNAINLHAYDFERDGIYYEIKDSVKRCVYVTYGDDDYTGNIVIPSTTIHEGLKYTVTGIGMRAFYACPSIQSVTIPNSITHIEPWAFLFSCLRSITIPSSVTDIGENAFKASRLTSIILPNSVTNLGNQVFLDCADLTSITLSKSMHIISYGTFQGCHNLKSVLLPDSLAIIDDAAFYGCYRLTSIVIPATVTYIGSSAFKDCYRLNTITLASTVPPACQKLGTFWCDEKFTRDKYDIYNYATLHVPMGTKDAYSSVYEWRYFNNVKEDMEQDGKFHYTTLRVKQGDVGYSEQNVKADEAYTIYLGTSGANTINTVIFNGKNVTREVLDGYYTTPDLKGPSVLSVTYETNGANQIASSILNDVKVFGQDGQLTVTNIDEPTPVNVYTVDGKLIKEEDSCHGTFRMTLANDERYIVKVGNRTFKVAL